ncbi:AraC family transcriptional regulator [Neobacillus cucumis]|uniref:AraC family transcriptional regulator n=1 Tax=Neobacillus cucumis TaxID=1740721 RepID=UPI001EF90A4D|nr:AraC family transcriptional regulator [Neobacillus cucumis]MBM7655770.1 AraC-like DNA-binding protein/quercetin dioxygenase-like cupin family protein [Neobacillus cucumis]
MSLTYRGKHEKDYGTYGFRFQDVLPNDVANIFVLGREEKIPGESYDWHGLKRRDVGTFVFQYTLSGSGRFDIEDKSYTVRSGEAFIAEIPSNHRYYFPKDSEGWEFMFITLVGREAADCWRFMKEQSGPVLKVPPDSKLIQLLLKIYQETYDEKITDAYYASAKAYEFIMECYRFIRNIEKATKGFSLQITEALSFIQTHFHEPITLDEIAAVSGFSRYYFIKQFQHQLNMTPVQYLTKIRIQKAAELLRSTKSSVTDIAAQVGYANANYFNKVFRKAVGVSAGNFRESKDVVGIDRLIID